MRQLAQRLLLALLLIAGLASAIAPDQAWGQVGLSDRVRDTTTTSGTGTYTLTGSAPTGSVAFGSAFATGCTVRYFVTDGGSRWEDATGVYTTSGNTLSRVVVEASSNSNNAVDWPDSTAKTVFVAPSARDLAYQLPTYFGTSGGSANAQTLTPCTVLRAYRAGHTIRFIAGFSNTGATTLAVSGLTARNVYKQTAAGPVALTGGEIVAGQAVEVLDDGTQYQLLSRIATALPEVLGKGGGITAPSNTSENTLFTVNVPPLAANSVVRVMVNLQAVNNANAKTLRGRFSGGSGTALGIDAASAATWTVWFTLANQNATGSQVAAVAYQNSASGAGSAGTASSAVNTTSPSTYVFTVQKGSGGDSFVIQSWIAELFHNGS